MPVINGISKIYRGDFMLVSLLVIGLLYLLTKWRFLKIVMSVILVAWLAEIAFCIGALISAGPTLMNMLSELINML